MRIKIGILLELLIIQKEFLTAHSSHSPDIPDFPNFRPEHLYIFLNFLNDYLPVWKCADEKWMQIVGKLDEIDWKLEKCPKTSKYHENRPFCSCDSLL